MIEGNNMHHIYVKNEKTLYSFPPHSVIATKNLDLSILEHKSLPSNFRAIDGEAIFYAGIAITNLCNLTCKHCPVSIENNIHNAKFWEPKEFERMIFSLYKQGLTRVSITGGEPFMHPYIIDLFQILNDYGIESKINTNGLLASPEIVKKLISLGLKEIDISINDSTNDSAAYFLKNNYALCRLESIKNLVPLKKNGLTITVSSVLTRRFLSNIKVVYEELKRFDVSRWRLREALPSLDKATDADVIPSLNEIKEKLSSVVNDYSMDVYGYIVDSMRGLDTPRRCKNLEKNYIYVSYNGECWWMAGLSDSNLGNIKFDGAKLISERLRALIDTQDPPQRCTHCPARFICSVSPYVE